MKIIITARHCEIESGVREASRERIEKLEKFARDIHEAHLIVTCEKYRHTAEITLHLNQHEMVSREESDEMMAAIELATDRLEHQLRKLKEKRVDRHRHGLSADERARLDAELLAEGKAPREGEAAAADGAALDAMDGEG